MKLVPTAIPEVILVEPAIHRDGRGFFVETWRADAFRAAGVDATFVQDNLSRSVRDTLRGLHAQRSKPQGKLVRAVAGAILDVAVDIRRGSPTFLRHVTATLSAENALSMWVPAGFAHGFCVLSETADVEYKCTDVYDPDDELRIRHDDPKLMIAWPVSDPILSAKDKLALSIDALFDRLPLHVNAAHGPRR